MRQPGQAIEVLQNTKAVADWPVTQQETAQVHRQDTAAVKRGGDCKNHDPAAQRQQRIQSGGQRDTVDHLQQQIAAAKTNHDPQTELLNNVYKEHPAQACFMLLDHLNQRDGQKHRHRVVTAGFNLQGGAHAFV